MAVKTRVRATSETVMGDVEVQHQRHRVRHVLKVGRAFLKPEWAVQVQRWSPISSMVMVNKESLSETSRPVFISTVGPDLSQPTHRLKEEDTIGESSSWDSRPAISVRSTESSTVTTACDDVNTGLTVQCDVGVQSSTSSYIKLWLRRVDVTK